MPSRLLLSGQLAATTPSTAERRAAGPSAPVRPPLPEGGGRWRRRRSA